MNLTERDNKVTWHPFRQLKNAPPLISVEKGKGVYLYDAKGNRYLDAFSSWWVKLHGHANEVIARKIYEQCQRLEQAAFSSCTHEPAVELAERLLKHLPGFSRIFYSDNGSTSVEVALKMAMQYHHNKGKKVKRIIAFENGYHGDTFGAMSVAERNVFNLPFSPFLFRVKLIPAPVKGKEGKSLQMLKKLLNGEPAIFIYEPLVQGAGGMVMYEPAILNRMIGECKKNNCITIADEVMTGFGRTGKFIASDYLKAKADIICLSKGITGGFMPLGVTACTANIYNAYMSADKSKTFYHGHSYTANPLACAAANASLTLLESKHTQERILAISVFFERMKKQFQGHPALMDCRSLGTIMALEIRTKESTSYLNPLSEKTAAFFLRRGILVRPLGNVLYFIPPYCITEAELKHIAAVTKELLDEMVNGLKNKRTVKPPTTHRKK
ncbi:MAG: adenosylmethionine--8-amino-7-oxononanoate transaminase [Bacteroidia bacterium]|nr:adenosylmethionine--8-amino-7-oxononanoate transaminase [Bacteroidia bacterium]